MVMKRNAMRRNLSQSILRSLGRYIAIVLIIALGAALFIGLLMTKADMVATGQKFMEEQNMFDLRLMNSYGWTEEYLEEIAKLDGIEEIERVEYLDLIATVDDGTEESVFRFLTIPDTLNRVALRGGRMPVSPNECLADGFHADDSILGRTIHISASNEEDSLESVSEHTFTVVGYVATPLYMDMNRGTTSVGSGSLSNYFYIPMGVLDLDYIPEINITIPGDYYIYTDAYTNALDAAADALEPELQRLADRRLEEVVEEAEQEYADGLKEYNDGLKEYNDGKKEAEQELADAEQELRDAEKEIADNEQLLKDGEEQLAEAKILLAESEAALAQAKSEAYRQMAEASAELYKNYKTVSDNLRAVENGLIELEAGLIELESGIVQLEAGLEQMDSGMSQLEMLIGILDVSIEALESTLDTMGSLGDITLPQLPTTSALSVTAEETTPPESTPEETQPQETVPEETVPEETIPEETTPETPPAENDSSVRQELQKRLEELRATRKEYADQLEELKKQREEYGKQLEELYATRTQLQQQKTELENNKKILEDAMYQLEQGMVQLEASRAQMEDQFASAQAQIDAGYAEIAAREQEIEQGWKALEEGKEELAKGWKDFEDGKREVEQELAEAWQKLLDGKEELEDARKLIDSMTENDVIILTRTSNAGYCNLESASDIVQGVSRVLPVFFLLVASLVCITTMTRMIDEERTQIGTLKALGYSNAAIISKYLIYSGSSALIGCGFGVLAGSTIMPMILWQAYQIMLYIDPHLVLTVDWGLCFAVVAVYSAVLLLVTWYCCRRTLKEEPAELIRPKSPDAGKKILMEYLPFWHKISFLNKVTIRNIFRYRQRLAMMLVGIGGCTALLVTGYGLRDSIVNVVDYQFEHVTQYDLEVYFRDSVTEEMKEDFLEEIGSDSDYLFYNQSSVDLSFEGRSKEIYMICARDGLTRFIDMHDSKRQFDMPGRNEILLSVGTAEALGIREGDTITLRSSDLEKLEVTVAGIYENHVYNYCVISPETIEEQWNRIPVEQMAYVKAGEGVDVHQLTAELSGLPGVMNVTVSADMANMVRNMMDALDLVVMVIVFCAGLLAAIVLYNLTNININERIREIATIKVLGFNAAETGAYVFKENLSLTVAGAVIGLPLGKLFLWFVMTQIKIDMVWFKSMVMPASYGISIALTMLAALIVDFIFYFRLQKINMAEALKSVE